jgi:hypothetical protein
MQHGERTNLAIESAWSFSAFLRAALYVSSSGFSGFSNFSGFFFSAPPASNIAAPEGVATSAMAADSERVKVEIDMKCIRS